MGGGAANRSTTSPLGPIAGRSTSHAAGERFSARMTPAEHQAMQRGAFQNIGKPGLNANLHPQFSNKLHNALVGAKNAGLWRQGLWQDRLFNEMTRSPEVQAGYYANYIGRPVTFDGKTYPPTKKGGVAARPGNSLHQYGLAADMQEGPVQSYIRNNAAKYGVETLASGKDKPHAQMAGARGLVASGAATMIGRQHAPAVTAASISSSPVAPQPAPAISPAPMIPTPRPRPPNPNAPKPAPAIQTPALDNGPGHWAASRRRGYAGSDDSANRPDRPRKLTPKERLIVALTEEAPFWFRWNQGQGPF
jgi:hypothetical protein